MLGRFAGTAGGACEESGGSWATSERQTKTASAVAWDSFMAAPENRNEKCSWPEGKAYALGLRIVLRLKRKDDRVVILSLILRLVLIYAFMLTDSCALRAFSSFL